jgi:hypothetical protein
MFSRIFNPELQFLRIQEFEQLVKKIFKVSGFNNGNALNHFVATHIFQES